MSAWKWVGGERVTVMMPVGATITYSDTPVKLVSNAVQPAGDGDTVWGVAVTPAASGASVAVDISPTSRYQAQAASGVNFAPGDPVYMAASYEIDAGSSSNLSAGNVVDYNPASAGLVILLLTPGALARTSHA